MGINLEYVNILSKLYHGGAFEGCTRVIDFGAQGVNVADHLRPVATAATLYEVFGLDRYESIDANGKYGAHILDLNQDVTQEHDFRGLFDVVTNVGTSEHCFNQVEFFRNIHNLCRSGGLMLHCVPAQGLVNHGFYNYNPRYLFGFSFGQ